MVKSCYIGQCCTEWFLNRMSEGTEFVLEDVPHIKESGGDIAGDLPRPSFVTAEEWGQP